MVRCQDLNNTSDELSNPLGEFGLMCVGGSGKEGEGSLKSE